MSQSLSYLSKNVMVNFNSQAGVKFMKIVGPTMWADKG